MTKREKNRIRTRAFERLTREGQIDAAREAWHRVWAQRRAGTPMAQIDNARLALLVAVDQGKTLAQAEKVARAEIRRAI